MVRMNSGPLVSVSAACAFIAVAARGSQAGCQALTSPPVVQQMITTRGSIAERESKLGNDYLSGHGVGKDEKQAAYWYEKAADAGNPWAQKQIGFFYQAGIGVPADPARAVRWYRLAAAGGLASARTNLGVAYLWGTGVAADVQMAAQFFREAAEKGDGAAATYLGNLYYFGRGVNQDKAAGEHWYTIGAKAHDPVAEFDLALLNSVEDHPHNLAKAAEWLRKSIAGGYVPAMHSLALLLEAHPELAKSDRESLRLFEKASGYGQWKSSAALGILYRYGKLIARQPGAAYYYLKLAMLQGPDQTSKQSLANLLQKLSAEMGAEQAAKQDGAVQAWYLQHHQRVEFLLNRDKDLAPGLAIVSPAEGVHAGQIIAASPLG